jgi:integrase/recombinase XerD
MKSITPDKHLTAEEVRQLEAILATAPDRDRILFSLLLYTGARASELLNVTKADISLAAKSITIRGLKGSRDRELPLPVKLLEETLALCSDRERPFPISYDRLHDLWQYYRPVKKKLHSLRHTRAIQLQNKTKDLKLVQFVLGHENIQNTMVYLNVAPEKGYLKRSLA